MKIKVKRTRQRTHTVTAEFIPFVELMGASGALEGVAVALFETHTRPTRAARERAFRQLAGVQAVCEIVKLGLRV
jgi:hypothetical protein